MSWQLRIHDPSGEVRFTQLRGTVTVGRGNQSNVILRDPTAPKEAAILWPISNELTPLSSPRSQKNLSPYWIKVPSESPSAHLGDLSIREANVPVGIPFQIGETKLTLETLVPTQPLPEMPSGVRPWLTCSEKGKETLWTAKKAAITPLSIYLGGETGTGKEVLAQLIHAWSDRKSGPFIPLNCGALPLSLAESELFGHVKGAYTGAAQHRPGALMQAHGGTLFLDEIGDLPLDIQVKLLRFLENGEVRAVGSDHASKVNARIICATHLPLLELVEQGKFRRDLYYRLASIPISIPTLRSRIDDIELLGKKFAQQLGKSISPRALIRLKSHTWPGNVRELQHAIERASGLSGTFCPVLPEDAFGFLITPENILKNPELELGASALSLREMERIMLLRALKLARGNRSKAAQILGTARSTVFDMLKRHQVMGPKSKE